MASESGFVRLSAVVAKNTFGSLERGSPQNGSIRRECLDHVIVFHESSLRRTLDSYFDYYHRSRTHLSLGARPATHSAGGHGTSRGAAAGRRTAPPLRTTGRLKEPESAVLRAAFTAAFETCSALRSLHTHASANSVHQTQAGSRRA